MKRRQFLGAAALPLVLSAPAVRAADFAKTPYSRELYDQRLASGKPFILDFYATW